MKNPKWLIAAGALLAMFAAASCGSGSSDQIYYPIGPAKTYAVVIEQTENGSVAADKTERIKAGETVTLTVSANENWTLASLSPINETAGNFVELSTTQEDAGKKYTFIMPKSDVSVLSTFGIKGNPTTEYSINVDPQIQKGSVTRGATQGKSGDIVTLTVAPESGYYLQRLTVTATIPQAEIICAQDADDITHTHFIFTMPASPVMITATFIQAEPLKFKVTFKDQAGDYLGTQTVYYGVPASLKKIKDLIGSPIDNYGKFVFKGWTKAQKQDPIDFADGATVDLADDLTLYLSWQEIKPLSDELKRNGNTVYFGNWPTTIKAKDVVVYEYDETKKVCGGHTYYLGSDGNYYAECQESPWQQYTYSDGSVCTGGRKSYFKVEPIKWRVTDKMYNSKYTTGIRGYHLLVPEMALTSGISYYDFDMTRTLSSEMIQPNNYKYSNIRAYLNGIDNEYVTGGGSRTYADIDWTRKGFLQTAFTEAAREKLKFAWLDERIMRDQVFLLSETELDRCKQLGLDPIRKPTDYAIAKGVQKSWNASQGALWGLRGPVANDTNISGVSESGTCNHDYEAGGGGDSANFGVVPAICIDR